MAGANVTGNIDKIIKEGSWTNDIHHQYVIRPFLNDMTMIGTINSNQLILCHSLLSQSFLWTSDSNQMNIKNKQHWLITANAEPEILSRWHLPLLICSSILRWGQVEDVSVWTGPRVLTLEPRPSQRGECREPVPSVTRAQTSGHQWSQTQSHAGGSVQTCRRNQQDTLTSSWGNWK